MDLEQEAGRVCSQYQLMIHTSFSNASVPFALALLAKYVPFQRVNRLSRCARKLTHKLSHTLPKSHCGGSECFFYANWEEDLESSVESMWANVPVNPHAAMTASDLALIEREDKKIIFNYNLNKALQVIANLCFEF